MAGEDASHVAGSRRAGRWGERTLGLAGDERCVVKPIGRIDLGQMGTPLRLHPRLAPHPDERQGDRHGKEGEEGAVIEAKQGRNVDKC